MRILASIKKLMRLSDISAQLTSHESEQLQLAMCTLMVEMMRADYIVLQKEKNFVQEVIASSMNLSSVAARELIKKAKIQSDFTLSLQSHTSVINNFLSSKEKQTFLKNLWVLANSDDELHQLECNMLDEIATELGFSPAQLQQICDKNTMITTN